MLSALVGICRVRLRLSSREYSAILLLLKREGIAGMCGVCGETALPGDDEVETRPGTFDSCLLDEVEDLCSMSEDDSESEN